MSVSKTGSYANGGNGSGRVLGFQDAQMLPSIYGIKGTEDLGGGLRAGFNLEGGFNVANGTHNSPGVYQSQVFGRETKVTLGGDWGTVGAGMQVDPGLIAAIATEPRGMTDSLSSLEHWIIGTLGAQGGPSPTATGSLSGGIFDVNSVEYSYSGNGLYLGLLYTFGGVAGSTSAGSGFSGGATYSNSGFVGSLSYAEEKSDATTGPTNGKSSQIDVFGLGYTISSFAVRAQYGEYKSAYFAGTAQEDVKNFGIGFDYSMGQNKVNLSYYRSKDSAPSAGGKTTEIALMDTYGLSKRSSMYAQIASVKTDANAGASQFLGGIYTPGSALGATALYIGLGVQHTF